MIETHYLILSLILIALLDVSAVAVRAAFAHASHARLLTLREKKERWANRTLYLFSKEDRLQASVSLVLICLRISIGGIFLALYNPLTTSLNVWAITGLFLLVAAILFCLEYFITHWVSGNADKWALSLTLFAQLIYGLATPVVGLLKFFLRKEKARNVSPAVTDKELFTLVDTGQQEGVFEPGEQEMIHSIIQLGDTLVREIMVPRMDILALNVLTPVSGAIEAFISSGHSRVPVYEDTIDHILGLLYAKDLLRVWKQGNQPTSLHGLLRPAYFVPETKKVDELLAEMQSRHVHMAIVVDEYGSITGLVTLENITEEILGDIQDEYDQGEESPCQELPNGEYLFLGRINIDDFNELMDSHLPNDQADTLAGYLYSRLGHVPEAGEQIEDDNLILKVELVSARRIRKVRVWRTTPHEIEKSGDQDVDR